MEDQVIVPTPAQLQTIIGEAVGAIIPKLADGMAQSYRKVSAA